MIGSRRVLAFALLALAAVAGCGKKGAPAPPRPRGPLPPREAVARQSGEVAVVGFEVPAARGGKPAQQPVRVELVRVAYRPGSQPATDPDAFRRRGEIVANLDGDPLPSGSRLRLTDERVRDLEDGGNGWTLRYAVRVRDRRGRPSPLVLVADLVPLPSVSAPKGLTAEPTADGMRLVWSAPPDAPHAYNVYRAAPDSAWPEEPLNSGPLENREFLDGGVETGRRYVYTVRVALAPELPYREGPSGASREVLAEDRFAPRKPSGLVAVQEGASVRLFWDPNGERDLAGYRVYRGIDGAVLTRLGSASIEQPLFLDDDVDIGKRIVYRVTAVDRTAPPNESARSDMVELELLADPSGADRP